MSDIESKRIFAQNLKRYMDMHRVNRVELAEATGIKYTTLTDYYNGVKYPRIDKIEILCRYFGIAKSDLIDEKKPATDNDGELEPEFINLFSRLTHEEKKMIVAQIKGILSSR